MLCLSINICMFYIIVLEEIEDRKQFLEEMTSVGMGHHYQNVINTEISQVTQLNLSD